MLERLFGVRAAGSTVRVEILGGATTFITMAMGLVTNYPFAFVAAAFAALFALG